MKHVLPRLVRPQMPGWPWKFSSSFDVLLLGWMRNYQLRAYYMRVNCAHGIHLLPTMGPHSGLDTPRAYTARGCLPGQVPSLLRVSMATNW